MIQDLIHKKIVSKKEEVFNWFHRQSLNLYFPFYSSFDIRDSGFKVVPVDANIFPAGFNNICHVDKENSVQLVREYLDYHYSQKFQNIVLITEEHTSNPFYWDNVLTLWTLLREAGRQVKLAFPRALAEPYMAESASGAKLVVHSAQRQGQELIVDGMKADLIIANNDFSKEYPDWIKDLSTPINPPYELGWHRRRKDQFFQEYNLLAKGFSELIDLDPWHLTVETERFESFDIREDASLERLATAVDQFLVKIKKGNEAHQSSLGPFAFVKNNAGTYGLGVTQVKSGQDVREWNYKSRKKMKAAKGGREIEEVIIQEGISSRLTDKDETAEPVIYMVGCQLAGGFLRTHGEKGPEENLNSPGAVFKRMCVSDLKINVEGCPLENVYGWVAKLAFLAIAREIHTAGVVFKDYKASCGERAKTKGQ